MYIYVYVYVYIYIYHLQTIVIGVINQLSMFFLHPPGKGFQTRRPCGRVEASAQISRLLNMAPVKKNKTNHVSSIP